MFARLRRTFRALRRRPEWERDLEDELASHIEQRSADLVRRGVPPQEASRRARLELGSREAYKEQCRKSYGLRWFDELLQDVRYAARTARRRPAFTSVAVLSLALGIGANTVVFSVLNAVVLRPLPVESPQQLVFVQAGGGISHSFPNYRDLRDRNTTLSGMLGYRFAPMGLDTQDGPRRIWGYLVTGNYFDVLGVHPALGRFFHAEDDVRIGASPLAVLNYNTWQTRYAADPSIVGKTIRINKLPYTVVGVAPRGFVGAEVFYSAEIWVPMTMQPQIEGRASWLDSRDMWDTMIAGRLKPGTTLQQAEANLDSIAQDLARSFPQNLGLHIRLTKPGLLGDNGRGPVASAFGGVMLLAALVLLAACANLASLLAARARDRHFELAIRLSIGAGRARILRQLMTEALFIAALGGAAGCALAFGLLHIISQTSLPIEFPARIDVHPDGRVLWFALGASLLTGLLFGVLPARHAVRADPNLSLRGTQPGRTRSGRWAARDLLLAIQVALCCFLVTASFVSLRGLSRTFEMPLGFQPRGLNVAAFQLGLAQYSTEQGRQLQQRAVEAVSQLPGVTAAGYGSSIPLYINQSNTSIFPERVPDIPGYRGIVAGVYLISPGYLHTIGTRILAGRDFTWHDDQKAPQIAIVNEAFARTILGTRNGVGKLFRQGRNGPLREVVAVVEDGKYISLGEQPRPVVYRPALQDYDEATVVVLRSNLPESEVVRQLRGVMTSLDPQLPVYTLGDVGQMLGLAYWPAQAATLALGAFGLLAVMLAITGIYGMAAYTVSQRVREIGIRVAIGAQGRQVLKSVLGRLAVLLTAGSAAGLAMGMAFTRVLASIVDQATPRDPVVLAAVGLTMVAIALAASWAPARRAISVDPVRSLRHE